MVARGTLYGVVVVLVAGILVTSTLATQYYGLYRAEASDSQRHLDELSFALTRYDSLATSFRASLADYDTTLSLLANAVADANTSSPAYLNASRALPALWSSYQTLASVGGGRPLTYQMKMKVDFGNGTDRWYNDTAIQPGWNGYIATLVLLDGKVQATWYPQFGEHFVTGIGGLASGDSNSWFVWRYGSNGWESSPTGVDSIPIYNGTLLAWTLCPYDVNFNPTCRP
ncbi:MAG: hypothetical protein HY297_00295 [Thaumarchaeota archaeon]|nr:hypothetical protein [Nitrososphaerota archaeon]